MLRWKVEDGVVFETPNDGNNGGVSREDHQRVENQLLLERQRTARLEALLEFPNADKDLLAMVSGSPEDIKNAAKVMHEKFTPPAPPPGEPAPPAPAATTQPPAPAPQPPTNGAAPPETQASAELRQRRMKIRSPLARKDLSLGDLDIAQEEEFKEAWNRHISDRQRGYSTKPVSSPTDHPVVVQ